MGLESRMAASWKKPPIVGGFSFGSAGFEGDREEAGTPFIQIQD